MSLVDFKSLYRNVTFRIHVRNDAPTYVYKYIIFYYDFRKRSKK